MVFAMAAPALAGSLFSEKDGWYYNAESAGKLVVKDNFEQYTFKVVEGENFLGLQRDYTGQLSFVSFKAKLTYVDVLVGYGVVGTLTRQSKGNLSDLVIIVTEQWERQWSNGTIDPFEVVLSGKWAVPNNVNSTFNVSDYIFAVVISGGGNSAFDVTDVTP